MSGGRRNPRAPTGWPPHTARGLTQPEEGQAESTSVSIETITAQGRVLGRTGIWGLETSPLPALGPGMGLETHAQTRVPQQSRQHLGLRVSSAVRHQAKRKEHTAGVGVGGHR